MAEKEQTTGTANFRESLAFLWHLEANLNTEASVRDWKVGRESCRGREGQKKVKGRTLLVWR